MSTVLIVTGEASGDLHGASLAAALKTACPGLDLRGVGGSKMAAAGVQLIQGIDRLDVMGLPGLAHIRKAVRTYRTLVRYFRETRLDAVVFIDNPGLNLRLARAAKGAGHRVIYYIGPQLWAWHASRIHLIKRVVDRMLVILPFEQDLYRRAGVPCDYVGNPVLDAIAPSYDRAELRKRFGVEPEARVIGLLPGSREREIQAHLPVMAAAAARLAASDGPLTFLLAQASSIDPALVASYVREATVPIHIVPQQPLEVMAASDLLLTSSGTATLQAAIVGTPMVIVYRTSRLTYAIGRRLVRVKWGGLPNLLANEEIVPELIQDACTPDRLAAEAARLLRDRAAYEAMRAALRRVREQLGEAGASRRAAEAVLATMGASA